MPDPGIRRSVLAKTTNWRNADSDADGDLLHDSLETARDAEVFEILREPVKNAVHINIDRVKISHFVREKVTILVEQIRNPNSSWRSLDPQTVTSWKGVIRKDGYDGMLCSISVVLVSRNGGNDRVQALQSLGASNANSSLNGTGDFVVVDGLHRIEAVRDISCDEPTNDEQKANRQSFSSIQVTVWQRTDKKQIYDLACSIEQLVIAEYCNCTLGRVRKADFADRVHAAVSTVIVLSKQFQVTMDQIRCSQLARAFKLAETVVEMSERNRERYAYIALEFGNRLACDQQFKDMCTRVRVGIVHLYSGSLFRLPKEGFSLAMEVLHRREHLKIRSSLVTVLDEIYSETNKLLACVQSAASKEGLSVSEVLEMELNISKTEKRTVRTSIVDSIPKISFQAILISVTPDMFVESK